MSILGVSLFWIIYDVMFMMLFLFFTSEINNRIVKAFFLPITKQNIGLCPNLNPVWTHIQSKSVGFFGKGGRFFFLIYCLSQNTDFVNFWRISMKWMNICQRNTIEMYAKKNTAYVFFHWHYIYLTKRNYP